MNVFDEARIVWGKPGLPGANAPSGQIGDIEDRLDALELAGIPDSIGDLTDVDLTGLTDGDLLVWDEDANGPGDGAFVPFAAPSKTPVIGISYVISNDPSAVTTGLKYGLQLQHDMVITGWTLAADVSSTTTVQVWIDSHANYPPTVADLRFSMTLAGSTTNTGVLSPSQARNAGDWVFFNVSANNNAKVLLPQIKGTRIV